MELKSLLAERKAAIVKDWFSKIIDTYPADTAKFLHYQKDPFANPVGATVKKGLEEIFDHMLSGIDVVTASAIMDPMIRIRAIQNFSPSQAVSFLFSLKPIIRQQIKKQQVDASMTEDLAAFEDDVDKLGLMAFDVYMKCREKLYEIQANEIRNRTFKAFKRAGLVRENPENNMDLKKL
jgi:hypothetical protein